MIGKYIACIVVLLLGVAFESWLVLSYMRALAALKGQFFWQMGVLVLSSITFFAVLVIVQKWVNYLWYEGKK